ncbi:dephospho-CoA kinase [Sediminibacillus dalangtanensis]|uniref:Dephospho-CoA kinase n=1 Tax=Sediminibacillus dalangtanensis TaxID=2729421 RepID=A0ABX7VU40_9BACI|nr:dephospho-CoA kinase [Sediminibacillus dalangtanensis]QTN00044.1 dephospho-CoA kinase [Sediminibacillus dalangtanensis]
MALVIGLTGGIASGKSTIAGIFAEWNIPIVDADIISRQVVEKGEAAYEQIVDLFGEDVLLSDGNLDRGKLGSIIFKDKEKREQLNNIVHPAVRKKMLEQRDAYADKGEAAVVLDIPLLYESGLTHFVDKVLVVYVDEPTQRQRLMDRNGFSEEEAIDRMNSQLPLEKKAKMADEIIDNNGSVESSRQQLLTILKKWEVPL